MTEELQHERPQRDAMWAFVGDDGRLRAGWRFLTGALMALLVNMLAIGIADGANSSMRQLDAVYRPVLAVLLLLSFSFLLKTLDGVEGNPLAALGLGWRRPQVSAEQHGANLGHLHGANLGHLHAWRDLATGVLIGGGMIALAVLAIAIGGDLTFKITLNGHAVALLAVVLLILITGALAEELMFRSYPFIELEQATGRLGAVAITSALFGAVHLWNPNVSLWAVIVTVTVGVLLALARLRTGALWMSWGIHFGWNAALGLVFGLPVSGLDEFAVVVHGRARGPLWLTGGRYGIEASVLGESVIIVGLIAVAVLVTQRE